MDEKHMLVFFIAATLLFTLFAFFMVYFLVVQNAKKIAFKQEKLQLVREHQRIRLAEQDRMFNTISREIHDNIGQSANLIRLQLHFIRDLCTDSGQQKMVDDAGQMTETLIHDARNISHSLNSEYIKANGLKNIIHDALSTITKTKGICCSVESTGPVDDIAPESRLIIFRIAQEAIQNALTHGGATQIKVVLNCTCSRFSMVIADNGSGFAVDKNTANNGIGLANMRNRADSLNGEIVIYSNKATGTVVSLTINELALINAFTDK